MNLRSDNKAINAIGFQVAWWGTALYKELSVFPVLLLVLIHFLGLSRSRTKEFSLVIFVALVGSLTDSILSFSGVFEFQKMEHLPIPFWLMTLWLSFACTLRHSLIWAFKNPATSFVTGAIGVPFSYFSAYQLGAIDFPLGLEKTVLILAATWGLLFLIFYRKILKSHETV